MNESQDERPKKFWDFNPKRGAICFAAGLIAVPLSLGLDYLFGMGFGWQPILFATLTMAAIAGIWGTLTEHIDF
jgi:hypothetical protein